MKTQIKRYNGKLDYFVTRNDGTIFEVVQGVNQIYKHCTWCDMLTSARIDLGLVIGDELPLFESFIQAVAYLKKNIDRLI